MASCQTLQTPSVYHRLRLTGEIHALELSTESADLTALCIRLLVLMIFLIFLQLRLLRILSSLDLIVDLPQIYHGLLLRVNL